MWICLPHFLSDAVTSSRYFSVIDDQIKLPLSQRWKDANHFRASVKDGNIVVESSGPRLVSASDDQIAVNY